MNGLFDRISLCGCVKFRAIHDIPPPLSLQQDPAQR
jgi:hypothetical protein